MNPLDDKKLFFDMQEHPENYSDEQLEAMMAELDKEPDTEAAWLRLTAPLRLPQRGETKARKASPLGEVWRGAAIFIAIAFLGIMSLASYRAFFYKTTTDNGQQIRRPSRLSVSTSMCRMATPSSVSRTSAWTASWPSSAGITSDRSSGETRLRHTCDSSSLAVPRTRSESSWI